MPRMPVRAWRPFQDRIEALPERAWWLLLLAAWAGCVALSLALCGDGFLHPEAYSFLPHYLSGRPLLQLIYDNRATDWDNYQAREPGFFFDWLDCHFIAWCTAHGRPHFFSASHYGLLAVAGAALWRMSTRHLQVSRTAAFGLVLLLWSCPSAMLYTSFYRAAKVGLLTAALLTLLAWLSARAAGCRWWRVALFGVFAGLLPMFDKQGLLFLVALVLFLLRPWLTTRSAADRRLLLAAGGALVFAWSYQRFFGPGITRALLGYEVKRGYTDVPWAELWQHPGSLLGTGAGAALLTFDSFRYALGSLPAGLALLALWWIRRWLATPHEPRRWLAGEYWFLGLPLFIGALYGAMLLFFPQLPSSEHRRFFYCLPVAGLWLSAAAAALGARGPSTSARGPSLVVWALVAGSFFALQEHRFVLRHGKYQPYVENATHVRAALLHPPPEDAGRTAEEVAALARQAPYFRDAVPPSLAEDRLFLTLRARMLVARPRPAP